MTDDHPFGHVAVVFAEIARTLFSARTVDSEGTAGGQSHSPPLGGNDLVSSSALSPQKVDSLLQDQRRRGVPRPQNTGRSVLSVSARISPAFAPLRTLVRKAVSTHSPYRPPHLRIADFNATRTQTNRVQSHRIENSSRLTSQQRNQPWQQATR